ncbi:MAG TPA: hypothetical protein VHO25_17240 [Polyangiaceae bacterium]|nr:hypothetical protein [Polyangiaceae bacterium]
MPYFRRGERVDAGLPAAATAIAAGSADGIVEKAAAILDSQPLPEVSHVARPVLPLQAAGVRPSELGPSELSPSELSPAQQRVSELLAGFLQLFAQSGLPAAPSLMKGIPSTSVGSIGGLRQSVPVIEAATPIAAGSVTSLALPLVNDGPSPVDAVPYCTDFVSNTGHQIAAPQVTFTPRSLPLANGAQGTTELRITVPEQAGPGKYSALVQAMGLDGPRAVVVLTVA